MPAPGTTMGRTTLAFSIANYADVVLARQGGLAPERVRRVTLNGIVDTDATRLVLPNPRSTSSA